MKKRTYILFPIFTDKKTKKVKTKNKYMKKLIEYLFLFRQHQPYSALVHLDRSDL